MATDPAILTWAKAVLAGIGAPLTQANLSFLTAWGTANPALVGDVRGSVQNLMQPTNVRSRLSLLQGRGDPGTGGGLGLLGTLGAGLGGATTIVTDPGKAFGETATAVGHHVPGANVISSVADFIGWITDTGHILRAAQVAAGGVLVLAGLVLLARQIGLATPTPPVAGAVAGAVS